MKKFTLATLGIVCALYGLKTAHAAALPEANKGIAIALKPTTFDQLKDWTLPATTAIKFDGQVPITGPGGKAMKARFDQESISVVNQYSGSKTFKVGDKFDVDTVYPDQVSGHYTLLIEKGEGGLTLRSYVAQQGQYQGHTLVLVDVNTNGRFDDAGVDMLIIDKTQQIKVGEKVLLGKEELDAVYVSSGQSITLGKAMGFGHAITQGPTDIDGAFAAWNQIREAVGSPALKRDPVLEEWGNKHIEYMKSTGVLAHPEDKSNPKYTPEGNKSGMGSCLGQGSGTAKDAILGQLNCFLHRIPLIIPPLETTGIAFDGTARFASFDHANGPRRKGFAWTKPIAYPPDGATDFSPGWSGNEMPNPIPGGAPQGGVGEPVTLTFPDHKITGAKIVVMEDGSTTEIEGYSSDPEHPAVSMFGDNMNTVTFIAKAPFKASTKYQVKVTATVGGQPFLKEWTFTTGKGGRMYGGGGGRGKK